MARGHYTDQRRQHRQPPPRVLESLSATNAQNTPLKLDAMVFRQARRLPTGGEERSQATMPAHTGSAAEAQRNIGPARNENANAEGKREEHVHDGLPDRVSIQWIGWTARRAGVGGGDRGMTWAGTRQGWS